MRRYTYVTDPHHLEDAEDAPSVPGPARRMARFIEGLVRFGSALSDALTSRAATSALSWLK